MSLSPNDIIRLEDRQIYLGVNSVNVYYYLAGNVIGAGVDIDNFALTWTNDVLPAIRGLQVDEVLHTDVFVENLTNGLDIYNLATNVNGLFVGTPASSSIAYGFRLNRISKITRNGSKRFVGVSEEDMVGNSINGAATARLNAVATALAESVVVFPAPDPNQTFFEPIIVGTNNVGQPDITRWQQFETVTPKGTLRTQVSRRPSA